MMAEHPKMLCIDLRFVKLQAKQWAGTSKIQVMEFWASNHDGKINPDG